MKNLARLTFIALSVFSLTGCGLWDSIFPPATPPPAPTASPYVYTPSPTTTSPLPTSSPTLTPVPTLTPSPTLTPTTTPAPISLGSSVGCLSGTWQSSTAMFNTYMSSIFSPAAPLHPEVVSGTFQIAMDGTNFNEKIDHLTMKMTVGGTNTMTMEMNGTATGTYTDNGSSIALANLDGSNLKVGNITLNGQPFTTAPIDMSSMFVTTDGSLDYQCSGNTLKLTRPFQDKVLVLELARI